MPMHRLHAVWSRGGTSPEDRAVCTFDFQQVPAAWPAAAPANYEEMEAAFDAFWTALRPYYNANTVLDELRWYREDDETLPWGDVSRVTDRNLGGSSANNQLPPQSAVTITERTSYRKHWGRVYLPAMTSDVISATGRFTRSIEVANAAEALYERWLAAGLRPVVIARIRPSANQLVGDPSPIQTLLRVNEVQVDDVFDVQRRRRYETVNSRQRRVIDG